jgi:hypothetical protein
MPILLLVGDVVVGDANALRDSISAYHDSVMRGVFVGILFAIGVFLYSYIGYEPEGDRLLSDDLAGDLACVFALGVALFPTNSPNVLIHRIHLVSATALFLLLSYFAIRLFTKTKGTMTRQKGRRNRVYRSCGYVMLGCIGLIAVYGFFLSDTGLSSLKPVFWLETIALWAFGVSWFVKGETLLRDNED